MIQLLYYQPVNMVLRKERFFSMLVFHPVKRLELLESYLLTKLGHLHIFHNV